MNINLPDQDWDEVVKQLDGSFLQSSVWGQFQQSQGREILRSSGEGWCWQGSVRRSHGLNYLMCSYGPAAVDRKSFNLAVESIVQVSKEAKLDFARVEPQLKAASSLLESQGAVQIGEADPMHTRVIDLKQDEDQLRKALSSGHRNLINGTQRRGISIRTSASSTDLNHFLRMLGDTAKRSGVTFYPDDYFRKLFEVLSSKEAAVLYIAAVQGEPVAAAIFYDWNGIRYYAHAGAYQELNRKAKASVSLVWQAIIDAKGAGMTKFDLWGVAPEGDPDHPLASLSKFKQAFGGEPVEYAGTWDIPLRRYKYGSYRVYRRLKGRK